MDEREQIIRLGKVLAAEERAACADSVIEGGLECFLERWRDTANGALAEPAVQEALALLAGYGALPPAQRADRIAAALRGLRAIFRAPAPPDASSQSETSTPVATTGAAEPLPPLHANGTTRNASRATRNTQKPAPPLALDAPLNALSGVGPEMVGAFKRLGLRTIEEVLYHFPHRYDDYSKQKTIAELSIGEVETVVAEVAEVKTFRMKNGRDAVEIQVSDATGLLKAVFFQGRWLAKQFPVGRKVVLSGKVGSYMGLRQMSSPSMEPYADDELIHTGRLVPVHPLTKGLHERNARSVIKQAVDRAAPLVEDFLPPEVRLRAGLLPLPEALAQMHFPQNYAMLEKARQRLGFDEFLLIQVGVLQRKQLWQGIRSHPLAFHEAVHDDFLSKLPFNLTGAQVRALKEIFADMERPVPMARLLQGDVGSGKTAVAAAALVQSIANGFQGALMAPTEILAEQHYKGLKALLKQVRVPRKQSSGVGGQEEQAGQAEAPVDAEALAQLDELKRLLGMVPEDDLDGEGVRVALLTGSLGAKERRRVLAGIAEGDVDLVIGTHALITEGVQYHSLGLVCIDEQHRFGVEQRQRLKDKGFNPHMLVMTATPIPRTLTLTIYGDLDTSILNERPPGRQPIKTRWISAAEREKAYKHLRREIKAGRQAFVICPLVEESEKIDLPSAIEMQEHLQHEVFPDLRVGLIHGQLLPREKDEIMVAFRNHEFDILVATAVVEVGIDVPNATTILIEGAERFGLSQLHQFRGRVGRGVHQSFCILVSDVDNEQTAQRLGAMEATDDGFRLAEVDLELRGSGDLFFGTRQSGTPDLKVARLTDVRLLDAARTEAQRILQSDPQLERPEHAKLKAKVEAFWAAAQAEAS
jgi:ATP-dependent DNA helicase RecG